MALSNFKTYEFLPDFGESLSPARVNRANKHLQINLNRWKTISPEHRFFILLHEAAHIALNTSNEEEVDKYAFDQYIKAGYSLTSAIKALTRVLHADTPVNIRRMWLQFQRAAEKDKLNKKFSQYEGYDSLVNNDNVIIRNIQYSPDGEAIKVTYDLYDWGEDMNAAVQGLKGLTKKEYKEKVRATQVYWRAQKARVTGARARVVNEESKTKSIYANQGIYVPTEGHASAMRAGAIAKGITGALAGAGKIVASAFGGGGGDGGGGGGGGGGGAGENGYGDAPEWAGVPMPGKKFNNTGNPGKRMSTPDEDVISSNSSSGSSGKRTKTGKKLAKNKDGKTPADNKQMLYLVGGIAVLAVLIVIMKR